MSDILTRLQPIFKDIFDNSDLNISRDSNADTVEGWDSLGHINLVVAIEQEFHIKFVSRELEALKNVENVGEMIDLMEMKLSR